MRVEDRLAMERAIASDFRTLEATVKRLYTRLELYQEPKKVDAIAYSIQGERK